jgi:hypothetical protein
MKVKNKLNITDRVIIHKQGYACDNQVAEVIGMERMKYGEEYKIAYTVQYTEQPNCFQMVVQIFDGEYEKIKE